MTVNFAGGISGRIRIVAECIGLPICLTGAAGVPSPQDRAYAPRRRGKELGVYAVDLLFGAVPRRSLENTAI